MHPLPCGSKPSGNRSSRGYLSASNHGGDQLDMAIARESTRVPPPRIPFFASAGSLLSTSEVGSAPNSHCSGGGPGLAGFVPSSSPQHWKICMKFSATDTPAGAPVQETEIAWLARFFV